MGLMGFAVEPVVLSDVEVVRVTWELVGARGRHLLPAGLYLTSPALVTVQALRCAGGSGDLGAFSVVTVALSCRSGARARATIVAGAVDADPATAARLVDGWAFPRTHAGASIERRYDAARVTVPGLVDATARDLRPIGVHDTQFVVGLHPTTIDGADRMVQVDLDVEPRRAERGRAVLHELCLTGADGAPLLAGTAVAAVVAVGAATLPRVRFVLDPAIEPHLGTTAVG
jgi:hypothetical protein